MRIHSLLAFFICAGSLCAQTMMPIPAFSRTYTAQQTRGFHFQAPIDFQITGLRVPDESNHGTQHVEVIVSQTAFPNWTTPASGGSVFYATNIPSSQIIPTSIPIRSGEYVGVLGACGDSSGMRNSYGASGPWQSSVLGIPVMIDRFICQFNIAVTGPGQPYGHANNSTISRVEVYCASACNGSITRSGTGCADTGTTVNTLSYNGCPDQGTTLNIEMNISASLTGPLFLVFGVSDQNWGGIMLPLDLTPFGAPGCSNYVSHEFVLGGLVPISGQATLGLQIPVAPFLIGIPSYLQGYHLNIGLNPLNLASTNYLSVVIG